MAIHYVITPELIQKAFKKTGIYPLNPLVFTDKDFTPSLIHSTTAHLPPLYPAKVSSPMPVATDEVDELMRLDSSYENKDLENDNDFFPMPVDEHDSESESESEEEEDDNTCTTCLTPQLPGPIPHPAKKKSKDEVRHAQIEHDIKSKTFDAFSMLRCKDDFIALAGALKILRDGTVEELRTGKTRSKNLAAPSSMGQANSGTLQDNADNGTTLSNPVTSGNHFFNSPVLHSSYPLHLTSNQPTMCWVLQNLAAIRP
ncbi:uncharacterized protein F5147DRAFT_776859 [Suillus discolor]|uniref:Uncharacterized protein n=1 Tax=Suillus discolor TaxID=1912936 RepID=A0A9P7F213_9AGAM|nr:uncharacterized protein F5147DRAFT_776859 [Suillus discolor]KAG2100651.1 hypothetical protein F5147DRAFT_776859 [Suillus discolor]